MNIENFDILRQSKPYYHPGKSGSLLISDQVVGFFGEVSPIILNSFDMQNKLVAFELNLTTLLKFYKKKDKSKNPLITSQYQASKRDFSFELDKDIFSLEIIKLIKNTNHKLIKDVKVFDSYEGEKINEKKKAVGFEVTIQSNEKTLTDDEINKISEDIISKVKKKYNAKLR
jgi:phenylalanyl-tRNA synthetase beta chain